MRESDVTIVGGGPAGMTAAFFLANNKVPVTLIEKRSFPRDKICGDCIGGFGLSVLKQMGSGVFDRFANSNFKLIGRGVHFFGPEHQKVTVRAETMISDTMTEVALCRRMDFDNFLYEEINNNQYIDIVQNKSVTDLHKNPEGIDIICDEETFLRTKLLILATGSHHTLVHKLNGSRQTRKHQAAGIRAYFENIRGLSQEGYIELHYLKELAPGYLWIFPLTGNQANVGLGLRSDIVSKRKINLRQILKKYINENAYFRERFKNARQISDISGYPLALGGKKRSISGNNYLLAGDAANLIEPLFGEGIGHAMYSGKFAAEHVMKCINSGNYSSKHNRQYDQAVYQKLGSTLSFSKRMHTLASYPGIIRFIINRVHKNENLEYMFTKLINGNIAKTPGNGLRFIIKLLASY
jgi:geranylgeranyl reductase family protein